MGRVENDRAGALLGHDRQAAEITHQRVVAEGGATVAGHATVIPGIPELLDDVFHIPGRQKLAFLDIDGEAGLGSGDQQSVWRQRKAGICSISTAGARAHIARAHAHR